MAFAGNIIARVGADIRPLQAAMRDANRLLSSLNLGSAAKLGGVLTASLTVPILGMGAAAVKSAADFEQAMANTKAVSGATSKEIAQLSALALDLGKKMGLGATEAANGITELSKAGLTTEQIINGGLAGALQLAVAGELDLSTAAEIASTSLNAFRKDGLSMATAANLLAGAANASATDVQGLQLGLSQVAAVSSSVGLSFRDTVTSLALFAQNGLKGSDAGTSLKTMLLNLQPTTKAQIDAFKKLGLTTAQGTSVFFDATGKLKSMSDIALLLQNSMKGMTDAQRIQTMETLFGTDAIRAANILYSQGKVGIDAMKASMANVTAEQVAAEKLNTFNGAMKLFKGSLDNLAISIGTTFLPALKNIAVYLTDLTERFNKLDPSTKSLILNVTLAVAVIGPLLILIGGMTSGLSGLAVALGFILSPIGLVVTAIAGLAVGITYLWNTNKEFRDNLIALWGQLSPQLQEIWSNIKKSAEIIFGLMKQFWNSWGLEITNYFITLWNSMTLIFSTSLKIINDLLKIFIGVFKGDWTLVWNSVKDIFNTTWTIIKTLFDSFMNSLKIGFELGLSGIQNLAISIWNGIKNAFKSGINEVIGLVNGFISKVNSIKVSIPAVEIPGVGSIGGGTIGFNIPKIPMLAKGGIVDKPTLAMIGEAGPEAVVPLGKMNQSNGMTINITGNTISSAMDLDNIANMLVKKLRMAGVRP